MSSPKDIEVRILTLILQAQEKGTEWVKARLSDLTDGVTTTVASPGLFSDRWKHVFTLGDAVTKVIKEEDKFMSARRVTDALWDFPLIAMELDERFRRRKVSQALYVQSQRGNLVSVKYAASTIWGFKNWLLPDGRPHPQYLPTSDDLNNADDDPGSM